MARITRKVKKQFRQEHQLRFDRPDGKTLFAIPCSASGLVLDEYRATFARVCAMIDAGELLDVGVETITHEWEIPAELLCDCGNVVVLRSFYNHCLHCGLIYNPQGRALN